jgi:hypothetical protein
MATGELGEAGQVEICNLNRLGRIHLPAQTFLFGLRLFPWEAVLFLTGSPMFENHDRRRFLQTSLAAGSMLTLGSATASSGGSVDFGGLKPAGGNANPKVRPGQVRWHEDFAAACRAAQRSGKPVFHFHMLGRLDQRFC